MVKKLFLINIVILSLASFAQEYKYTYSFFTNSAMSGDYFFSHASCSGGSTIKNVNAKLLVSETFFHTPGNALELQYKNAAGGRWQAIIFNHKIRGVDHFAQAKFLSFWIYAAAPFELPVVQLMRKDSSLTSTFNINIKPQSFWQQVRIPLSWFKNPRMNKPEDVIAIVFSKKSNQESIENSIYIDDIEMLPAKETSKSFDKAVIKSLKGYAKHVDITWNPVTSKKVHMVQIYRSENGDGYRPVGIQSAYVNRYSDFTAETGKKYFYLVSFLDNNYKTLDISMPDSVLTKSMTDDELLTMVQEASFRYYWEGAEPNSGLAKEDIPGRQNMIATGASGFGIMALLVGTERGFITRDECVTRFIKIVNFLEKAETFHGVYPHFIDGTTGKVEPFFGKRDNGADLVETSFLLQGLLAARQYFSVDNENEKLIRQKITNIWAKVEWNWFTQYPDSKFLYWHWSPDQGWVINHRLIGWNETMVTYLLAIASPTHAVPANMYYSGWANQDSIGQKYRSNWGHTTEGSKYTNGNTYFNIKLDVGVSNGGPLFFTHYSYMGYDPHFITDNYTNYFANNQNIAKINYQYCVENQKHFKGYGESAWGLTASDGPFHYSADEPVPDQDRGKIAPTGAISSFPYTPEESMKALKNYYYNYGKFLWGEYGFKDAFDLTNNWCSEIYMGLNQAPQVVMIENYRTGLIWKLFMQIPEIQNGLKKLDSETNLRKE